MAGWFRVNAAYALTPAEGVENLPRASVEVIVRYPDETTTTTPPEHVGWVLRGMVEQVTGVLTDELERRFPNG